MDHFIQSLRLSASRFSDAVRRGPLDAPVAACPGWTLGDLGHHLGNVHRWARAAAATAAPPDEDQLEHDHPPDDGSPDDRLATWIDEGADALAATLATLDPTAPTWHPFPTAKVAGVWPRRQAHETMIHSWDAERAVGSTSPLDPAIAADGIAEYFELIVPRVIARSGVAAPVGVLDLTCTDVDMHLLISCPDDHTVIVDASPQATSQAAVALKGSAEQLLLALWGRARPEETDSELATLWLSFGGN